MKNKYGRDGRAYPYKIHLFMADIIEKYIIHFSQVACIFLKYIETSRCFEVLYRTSIAYTVVDCARGRYGC